MGLGVVGAQAEGLHQAGDRLVGVPPAGRGDAEAGVGLDVIGLEAEDLVIGEGGLGELSQGGQGVGQVEEGFGVVGLMAEGLLVAGDGRLELALVGVGQAELGVGLGEVGPQRQGLCQAGNGVGPLAEGVQGHAERRPRRGVARVDVQDLVVELLGLAEVAGLLTAAGQGEQFGHRGHGESPAAGEPVRARLRACLNQDRLERMDEEATQTRIE